jgi:hypothetical protein
MNDRLHIYRCSLCSTTAATAVPMPRLNCPLCYRFMALQYDTPVETDRQRYIFKHGLVFSPFVERKPKKCDTCQHPMIPAPAVVLQGVGEFCGKDCADAGVRRHEQFMVRIQAEADAEHAALLEKFRPKHRPVEKAS